jgi:hypothetical protein
MKRSTVIVIGVLGLLAAPASASPGQRETSTGPVAFSGSCALSGIVRFQPPLTTAFHPVRNAASGSGTCSGTLTDQAGDAQQLDGTQVSYTASDTASSASCALSTEATGTGELVFPGTAVSFELSETRVGAIAQLTLTGSGGGSAVGVVNVSPSADPVQILQECAGTGLVQAPIDLHIDTTGISG